MDNNKILEGNALYICYFGLREPLVQTQVLPYIRQIREAGINFSILTFEANPKDTWTTEQIEDEKAKLAVEGIKWNFLTYHKAPSAPATVYDVLNGARLIREIIEREQIDILHARIHTPALMGLIAKKLSRKKPKLIFDIRGFFPEEYTDGGMWKENGWLYKSVKRVEKRLLKESDGFVVLTEKARSILFPESKETGFDKVGRPVEVIPCCVDLHRFEQIDENAKNKIQSDLSLKNKRVIVYVGSLGTWYLADEMADLMETAREENAQTFALVLTQSAPEIMSERLKTFGFSNEDFLVIKVAPAEIPKYLSAADIAVSFIKPCFSKLSSSPTKIAEYLASGIPVITNRGVGDVAEQIETDKTGAIVEDFSRESYRKALRKIENLRKFTDLQEVCRQSARERFDLERVGGAKYRLLYEKILGKKL